MFRRLPTFGLSGRHLAGALAIAFSTTFLLFGYEFVRAVAQSLFVEHYGTRLLPRVMAAAPVGTLLLVYGYGRLLSATGPRLAILLSTAASALVLEGCRQGLLLKWAPASIVLYIFREGYIVLLVEQVWSFLNSILTTHEGRRVNGLVCGIASLGPIAGGLAVSQVAEAWGSENLLLLASLSLVPVGILSVLAYRAAGEPAGAPEEMAGRRGHLGLGELARNPVLRRMALLILITQAVSTALELGLNVRVKELIPDKHARTAWFGGMYAMLNMGAAVFQFILTPLALRFLPLMAVHTAIPLLNMAAAAVSFLVPGLVPSAGAYMTFKILDYSMFRAAKEILYIPLSFDARFRAKEVIDAFGYRVGKGVSSALFDAAGGLWKVFPPAGYPLAALAALAAWVPVARGMVRETAALPAATVGTGGAS